MRTYALAALVALVLVGCSSSAPVTNNPPAPETAVTFDNPTQKQTGTVTMAELCEKAGITAFPGSEKEEGIRYDRSDSGTKDEIIFETPKSLEEVGKFFEAQKLSTKVTKAEGSSMGMTKTDAQLIISYKPKGTVTEVTVRSLWYPKKAK